MWPFRKKENIEEAPEKKIALREEDETLREMGFDNIEQFNESSYMSEIFLDAIQSIRNEEGWTFQTNKNSEMSFTKERLDLKVTFDDSRAFRITSISMHIGYRSFHFYSKLKESEYRFFYEKYADTINSTNSAKKERIDRDLSEIRSILGKSSSRDRKIDSILGG